VCKTDLPKAIDILSANNNDILDWAITLSDFLTAFAEQLCWNKKEVIFQVTEP